MKIRNGFVSNSSSSSFIINKKYLSVEQIDLIKRHFFYGAAFGVDNYYEKDNAWEIAETKQLVIGSTDLDRFDMSKYLFMIGVALKHIKMNKG
jgi:hypothetical protein